DQKDRVRVFSVSADGRIAVSTSDDNKLRLWNIEQQVEVRQFPGHNYWPPVALTPDGSKILACFYVSLQVLNTNTGEKLGRLSGHTDLIRAVAIDPAGKHAFSASEDRTIRVWDLESGLQKKVFSFDRHYVRSLTVTPDGTRLLS